MDTKKKETEKTAAPTAAATNVTEKVSKPKSALELLEEDDEFEVLFSLSYSWKVLGIILHTS